MAGSEAVRRRATWAIAVAVALFVTAVYRATMLPGLGAWDTGEAQTVPTILGTMHPTGFPAYVVLGWLTTTLLGPFAEAATIMNFLSALLVAVAVGGTVFVARRLGAPPLVAGAAALGFGLTPIVWSISLSADAHALHIPLVVLVTLGLLRWEERVRAWRRDPGNEALRRSADRAIVGTAALFGVAIANHALSLLLIPAIGLFVLATDIRVLRRPKLVLGALGACAGVAAVLYLQLPLRSGPFRAPLVYGDPSTLEGFLDIVLARQFQADISGPLEGLPGKLASLYELASAQFGVLLLLFPAGLLIVAVRFPRYALYSVVAVLVTCFFAASYSNASIGRYYLGPAFFGWTWLAALFGAVAMRILGEDEGPVEPAAADADDPDTDGDPGRDRPMDAGEVPSAGPRPAIADRLVLLVPLAMAVALLVPTAIQLRDRWVTRDLSSVTWVHTWLDEAFAVMDEDAVVVSWWSYSTPLWYGQHVEGRRPDVWIVDDRTRIDEDLGEVSDVIEANLDSRPVYLIRLQESEVQALRDRYTIEPVGRPGNVFRVTGRQESSP